MFIVVHFLFFLFSFLTGMFSLLGLWVFGIKFSQLGFVVGTWECNNNGDNNIHVRNVESSEQTVA